MNILDWDWHQHESRYWAEIDSIARLWETLDPSSIYLRVENDWAVGSFWSANQGHSYESTLNIYDTLQYLTIPGP